MFEKKHIVIIFLLALIIRIVYVLAVEHAPLENDAKEYDTLGYNLSIGNGYINLEGEPTAFRPPIYPFILGSIYYVAGHNLMVVRLIQTLFGAGICIIAYLISGTLFDRRIAKLSGYMCCLYPPLIIITSQILTETIFTFFLVIGIFLIISDEGYEYLFMSNLFFGIALLTKPILIFFIPFQFYWIFINKKYNFLKAAVILCAAVLLIILPWTIRNYYKLNSFVPLANGGGISFYSSHVLPDRGFGYTTSLSNIGDEYNRLEGETEKNRYLIKKTFKYIMENPIRTIKLSCLKPLYFIYPFDGYWYSISFGSKFNMFFSTIFLFSIFGLIMNRHNSDVNFKLIYFLFISFLIGIIVFEGIPRYRLPIDPLLICFAAFGIIQLFSKKLLTFTTIIVINIILFFIFRYLDLRSFFNYLKAL